MEMAEPDTTKLYIVHQWAMEKLRALIISELNAAGEGTFIDLSGTVNSPSSADESWLQEDLLERMAEADVIAILIPDPMFTEKDHSQPEKSPLMSLFVQEHMLLEFESRLAHKPVVPMAFSYRIAEEYARMLRTGEAVARCDGETSPDSVIPLPIDINDRKRFARGLKRIAWMVF